MIMTVLPGLFFLVTLLTTPLGVDDSVSRCSCVAWDSDMSVEQIVQHAFAKSDVVFVAG